MQCPSPGPVAVQRKCRCKVLLTHSVSVGGPSCGLQVVVNETLCQFPLEGSVVDSLVDVAQQSPVIITHKKTKTAFGAAKKGPGRIKLRQAFYQRGSEGHNVQASSWPSTQLTRPDRNPEM